MLYNMYITFSNLMIFKITCSFDLVKSKSCLNLVNKLVFSLCVLSYTED